MNEILKSRFTRNQIELAASIGLGQELLKEKIALLFSNLNDPLLTSVEVKDLLGIGGDESVVSVEMTKLVKDNVLELTNTSSRPLDIAQIVLYRQVSFVPSRLRIFGTASRLSDDSIRFEFTIEGRVLRQFARVDRLDSISGEGSQRDEIKKHVTEIAKGINAGSQVPNSVIVVFDSSLFAMDPEDGEVSPESWVIVKSLQKETQMTHPTEPSKIIQRVWPVEISIPFRNAAFDDEKPAMLVDGQQRTAALSIVDVDDIPEFYFSVNALIADNDEAKAVFQIANSTVKISSDFSRALLGTMSDAHGYQKPEQIRAKAVQELSAKMTTSPFLNLVKMPGSKKGKAVPIAYNTLFAVVSMFTESQLDLDQDPIKLAKYVAISFEIIRDVWPIAWGKPPTDSRLMHGAGLRSMTDVVIDLIESNYRANNFNLDDPKLWTGVKESLIRLSQTIQWTAAEALDGTVTQKNNYIKEIQSRQNTAIDITALTTFLNKEVISLDKKAAAKVKK